MSPSVSHPERKKAKGACVSSCPLRFAQGDSRRAQADARRGSITNADPGPQPPAPRPPRSFTKLPRLAGRLQSALADRYRLDREVGAGGMATVYLAAGRPPRPAGGAQGAPARARRRDRRRAVPGRDQAHGQPPAPAHPAAVRLGRGRRLPVLRHALRRGRDAARPAQPREAAPRRRRGPDRDRGGLGARLRPPPRRGPPRHQAREHPAARRPGAGGRLRHRAGRQQGQRLADDRDRHVAGHAALHEPRAGDGRARDHRPLRRLRARRGAVRDAHRRPAVHRLAPRRRSWRGW